MTAARAFTLIEVVVALALGVVVIGAATLTMQQVSVANHRQRTLSELQRDGEFASQLMTQEIRQAGLGIPLGSMIAVTDTGTSDYGTGTATTSTPLRFPPTGRTGSQPANRLLVGNTNAIGILGDLPRPDSNYALFGPIHDRSMGRTAFVPPALPTDDWIAWHTENNGTCVQCDSVVAGVCPAAPGCTTSTASLFFPGAATNCVDAASTTAQMITCPWGSRRLAPGEHLQVADGGGNWSVSKAPSPLAASASPNGIVGLHLPQALDRGSQYAWQNQTPNDGPSGPLGQGFVTTLDRVFFKLNGTNIERRQCWGDPDPNNANWPPSGTNTVPATLTVTPAVDGTEMTAGMVAASTCIGPEVVARNVTNLQFQYFDAAGGAVAVNNATTAATLNTIRRVTWTIKLSKTDALVPVPVTFTILGGTALQN
jgi:prepilin-type N-terminal cleavage/methylation domain-containing protein